ncbi:MAG: zinc-ribbon domain-containing protein [Parvularculaceae bacterium]
MITTCPDCATQYEVDTALIPTTGRQVRCSACQALWHTYVPDETPSVIDLARPTPSTPAGPGAAIGRGYGVASGARYSKPSAVGFARPVSFSSSQAATAALFNTFEDVIPPGAAQHPTPLEGHMSDSWEDVDDIEDIEDLEDDFADLWIREGVDAALEQSNSQPALSPFHTKLNGLQGALEQAGLIAGEDDTAASSSALIPSQASSKAALGPVLDQANMADSTRQISQAKEAAKTLARVGTALVRTQTKKFMALPVKIPFASTPTAQDKEITPQEKIVTNYRRKLRWQMKNRMTPLRLMSWLLFASVIPGLLFAGHKYRTQIMDRMPRTTALYAMIGLAPVSKVELIDVSHRYAMSDGGPVIELRGVIRNNGDHPLLAPQVSVGAYNWTGRKIDNWIVDIPVRALQPGMETPFIARADAPVGVSQVRMSVLDTANGARDITPFAAIESNERFFIQRTNSSWGEDTLQTTPVEENK